MHQQQQCVQDHLISSTLVVIKLSVKLVKTSPVQFQVWTRSATGDASNLLLMVGTDMNDEHRATYLGSIDCLFVWKDPTSKIFGDKGRVHVLTA